ncbi:MAG: hypothetical protein FJ392_07300 [Verrucomicrobia bacterium]|nr:hypothetical protein [Verrucomicrobiota bacterium]
MKCELAAEAWFKAATRWRAANHADIELATDSKRLVATPPTVWSPISIYFSQHKQRFAKAPAERGEAMVSQTAELPHS